MLTFGRHPSDLADCIYRRLNVTDFTNALVNWKQSSDAANELQTMLRIVEVEGIQTVACCVLAAMYSAIDLHINATVLSGKIVDISHDDLCKRIYNRSSRKAFVIDTGTWPSESHAQSRTLWQRWQGSGVRGNWFHERGVVVDRLREEPHDGYLWLAFAALNIDDQEYLAGLWASLIVIANAANENEEMITAAQQNLEELPVYASSGTIWAEMLQRSQSVVVPSFASSERSSRASWVARYFDFCQKLESRDDCSMKNWF
jgi:hypothetical protein